MIDLVKLILAGPKYEVVGAMGGQEGIRKVEELKPSLVLLDLMMPDMSGWDVYQQMKAIPELEHIPVVVVTAKAGNIDKVLGLHVAKVQAYITKPFSPSELTAVVERVLAGEVD